MGEAVAAMMPDIRVLLRWLSVTSVFILPILTHGVSPFVSMI